MLNQKVSMNQLVMLVLSLGVWWLLLGSLGMAMGFFALIFVHEMGHFVAARQKGLSVTLPTFTPFGAYVQTSQARNAIDEAYVAFAGPLIGGIASLATMVAGAFLGIPQMIQVGVYGVFLNLFNLIPLEPLDGGHISQPVSRWFWIPGVAMLGYALFVFLGANVFNLIIGFLIFQQAYMSLMRRNEQRATTPSFFQASATTKVGILVAHVSLALGLGWVVFNQAAFLKFFFSLA
jgi:Zn-dependent protease